jgi:hypothetical protein
MTQKGPIITGLFDLLWVINCKRLYRNLLININPDVMERIKFILTAFILIVTGIVSGQQLPSENKTRTKNIFLNTSMIYISNLTYAGRKAEPSVPSLLPSLTLISKKGFFLNGIGYFDLNGSDSQAEGLSITSGYVFSFDSSKKFGGSISATKYFITNNSPIILSSFNASVDGQLNYNPGVVKLSLGGSYRNSNKGANDFINNAELSKQIQLHKAIDNSKSALKITPTLNLYSGTQSFTETYYTSSEVQRAVNNPSSSNPLNLLFPNQPSQTIINQTVTEKKQREVKKYNLLALSCSAPLTYNIKKVQFNITPYFIKPFNQVNYVNNTSEKGVYFLFSSGLSVTF